MILDEFDPKKPFYALVLAYLCQVHGFFELVSRGLYQRFEKFSKLSVSPYMPRSQLIALFLPTFNEPNRKDAERVLSGGRTELLFEPELQSKCAPAVKWDSGELAETVFSDKYEAALRYFNRMSAGSLLILAWDQVPSKHWGDPIVQFLRHCRNAAAHNGTFTFKRRERVRPAEWRTLTIVRPMQGDVLFADPPKPGFIGIGDAVYLLADIEKKFF